MVKQNDILIVGGDGVVGQRIAADLVSTAPDRIVVAARNPKRANQLATALGHGARGRSIYHRCEPSALVITPERARGDSAARPFWITAE